MKIASRCFSLLLTFLLVFAFPAHINAWGDTGHHLVVRLAMKRLMKTAPAVKNDISDILDGENLFAATMWPDSARFVNPYKTTYNNHFVDISFYKLKYEEAVDCKNIPGKGDCVIHALDRYSQVLLTPGSSKKDRRDALAFILHFVGDMHQPMHATQKDHDLGGNNRKICLKKGQVEECFDTWNGERKAKNLHATWDSYIIESAELSEDKYFDKLAKRLDQMLPGQILAIEKGSTVKWAEDAHRISVSNAYKIGNKTNGFYHLNSSYLADNLPSVEQQILYGGIRLALVLREIFVEHHAHPSS